VRVLIHSIDYAPEVISGGNYNGEMCDWLTNRGHEVRVVTAPPFYPEWRVREGYSAWAYRRERIAGVGVWRSPTWIPAEPSAMKRLLHLTSFAVMGRWKCFRTMRSLSQKRSSGTARFR